MSQFKRPGSPPGAPLKEREKTAAGFTKPATAEKKPLAPLEKKDIGDELRINDLHINEELMGQPLLMKKYTKLLAQLNKKVKAIKNKLEMQEAGLYITLSNDGRGRKVAEIEAMVVQDAGVQTLRIQLYDAEEEAEEYTGIVRSIAQRIEALKELSMNTRKEMS